MSLIEDDVALLRDFIAKQALTDRSERLPPEPKLCETLGISRGRLRTVLKRLENEGVIWRHVGKGTFIGPRQIRPDDMALSAAVSLDDLLGVRFVLEPQLAAQAAIHATPADIDVLEQCLTDMAGAGPFMHWKRSDERLHRSIAEATHNGLLVMLYDTMRTHMHANLDNRIEAVYSGMQGPRVDTDAEHAALVEAIRLHDPDRAEQAMRAHLRSVRTRLFGQR